MAIDVRQVADEQLEAKVGSASLQAMAGVYIDDVLAYTDRGLDSLPSYMDLYHRAIRQQWNPDDLDFSRDREEWAAHDSSSPAAGRYPAATTCRTPIAGGVVRHRRRRHGSRRHGCSTR